MKHSTAIAVVVAASLASETSAAHITMASFLPASKLSIATTAIVTTTLLLKASAGEIDGWNLGNVLVDAGPYQAGVTYQSVVYDSVPPAPGGISYGGIIWVESDVMEPGMKVVTDGTGTMDRDKSCIMTAGFDPNNPPIPKQCDDEFQSSKRVKVYTDDLDGPVDLVYDVSPGSLTDAAYRFFLKYENLSDKRIQSFKLELGTGIGDLFVPSGDNDGLYFTDRAGTAIAPGDAFPNDIDLSGLFAFGLFGDETTNQNQVRDGYYDPVNRGIFNMVVGGEDSIEATMVSNNIASLYGGAMESWIPKSIAPLGFFYDIDGDPFTDPVTVADFDDAGQGWQNYRLCTDAIAVDLLNKGLLMMSECRANASDGPAPISLDTIQQWKDSPLFEQGSIEDLSNVNINTHIKVEDALVTSNRRFTIGITPTADETTTGAPWLPSPSSSPSAVPSASPSMPPSDIPSVSTAPSEDMTPEPTCAAKGTKAPSGTGGSKGTKAPTDPLCDGKGGSKGTKAPSLSAFKGTKAPSFSVFKGTKAPSFKDKGSKSKGGLSANNEAAGTIQSEPVPLPPPEPIAEPEPAIDTPQEDPSAFYTFESNETQQGVSTPVIVGTAFAVGLIIVLCVNVAFLYLFCRADNNGGASSDGDPYGTKVTVHYLKDGRVLVKKTVPLENGSEVVQKTVYPTAQHAAGHGFVPDLC